MAARIRKDDMVVVIAGDHKGQRGKVLRLLPDKQRVVVEGVNMVYRHVRKSRQNPQGGRIQKEAPIHLSNVQPLDPKADRGVRVRYAVTKDESGKVVAKQRVAAGRRSSGVVLGDVRKAAKASEGGKR